MAILAIKSIPLMRGTNEAWKTIPGLFFADRKRNARSIERHIGLRNYDAVLNLGRVDVDFRGCRGVVFNDPITVKAISTPKALRRTLNDYIPEYSHTGRHWHKSGGFGGVGTAYFERESPQCAGDTGDAQSHVDGTEYRIVTVGDRIVQASRKGERRTLLNGRNDFAYTWIGVDGIRKDGFIPLLKEAVGAIPGGLRSVLGWDVLRSGDVPTIIEINTCPGVNSATAGRIISGIREMI